MTRKSGYRSGIDAVASEHAIQCGIVEWVRLFSVLEPKLRMLYAIPNGGKRSGLEGFKLRDEGVARGVPDLCLASPGKFGHALYIEVKTPKGRTTDEQGMWHQKLREAGYGCVIVTSVPDGIKIICEHIGRIDLAERVEV